MRESEARLLVARLAASWPRVEWSDENTDAYVSGLLDLDAGELDRAVEAVRRKATFLPTIAELRATVAEQRLNAPGVVAAFASAAAKPPRHPLVDEARRLTGDDWTWRTGTWQQLRREFEKAYAEVLGRERDEIVLGELAAVPAALELEAATS